ncbi:hypothetical protein GCM10009533_44740 [Saccharopolyspora spinosporotrichia]|uniref:Uncharacterized protein n=1 Tax=Saccharopolyspora erythraea TaxID=1836 RepID=A0ABP3NBN3_SACER
MHRRLQSPSCNPDHVGADSADPIRGAPSKGCNWLHFRFRGAGPQDDLTRSSYGVGFAERLPGTAMACSALEAPMSVMLYCPDINPSESTLHQAVLYGGRLSSLVPCGAATNSSLPRFCDIKTRGSAKRSCR